MVLVPPTTLRFYVDDIESSQALASVEPTAIVIDVESPAAFSGTEPQQPVDSTEPLTSQSTKVRGQ